MYSQPHANCCSFHNTGPIHIKQSLACTAEQELSSELVHVCWGCLYLLVSLMHVVLCKFAEHNRLFKESTMSQNPSRHGSVIMSVVSKEKDIFRLSILILISFF